MHVYTVLSCCHPPANLPAWLPQQLQAMRDHHRQFLQSEERRRQQKVHAAERYQGELDHQVRAMRNESLRSLKGEGHTVQAMIPSTQEHGLT